MFEIFLPERILFGDDSTQSYAQSDFESVLIISDKTSEKERDFIEKIQEFFDIKTPKTEKLISNDFCELYSDTIKYISENEVDRIVAIGSARLIDTAMMISYQSGVGFAAVPFFSSCAMTDFEEADYKTYRKSPKEVIIEPRLAMYVDSGTVAYDAMSCFAYAVDSVISSENNVIDSLALSSAAEILNNIVGAYRGNFKALQKLQNAMYCAVLAHRNTVSLGSSVLDGVTSFFVRLGVSKQTSAAICIAEIADYCRCDSFGELARQAGLYRPDEDMSFSVDRLIERIRRVQAAVNIPRCIGSVCSEREMYSAFRENSHLPSELLDLCYHGSFKFMKL